MFQCLDCNVAHRITSLEEFQHHIKLCKSGAFRLLEDSAYSSEEPQGSHSSAQLPSETTYLWVNELNNLSEAPASQSTSKQ